MSADIRQQLLENTILLLQKELSDMLLNIRQNTENIRQWMKDCRNFFNSTAEINRQRNWKILYPMSVLYLVYICFYMIAVCPVMDIALQTYIVRAFALLHGIFTLRVFIQRNNAPSSRAVSLSISLFAAEILGLAGILEISVFTDEVSFIFPLCLILMTQIYVRPPLCRILEITIPAAVYLFFCWMTKDTGRFLLDVISVSTAAGISAIALLTIANSRLQAYQTQIALEKMCALDAMTGVNNKSTFEFRVESFLHGHPKSACALAICDLNNFKNINDTHGHRMGDIVLQSFAAQLHLLSDNDPSVITGRFGGDEFVIFMTQYDSAEAAARKIAGLRSITGFDFPVTCSIGIAAAPSGCISFHQLFDCADRGLYRAKAGVSGGICTEVCPAVC